MARTVGIGIQSFEKIRENDCFYVDKTGFIKEWWENKDDVTLITRPRRFGKTLTMSMLEQFFSVKCQDKSCLFEGLSIWEEERYRKLQGTYPVIFLSFAEVKENKYPKVYRRIKYLITGLYSRFYYLLDSDALTLTDKNFFRSISADMEEAETVMAIQKLSEFLYRHYGKRAIILLDEYDTPLQEAYVGGFWEELTAFTRGLFNLTFKTNPYLERAVMTGITRVSKESVFSDLNYLDKRRFSTYWANTSSNSLAGKLIREGSRKTKLVMEDLLEGKILHTELDEQIVYSQLDDRESAVWSLLLASGYLRVKKYLFLEEWGREVYDLVLTNKEVRVMFERMIRDWFDGNGSVYNDFVDALLRDNKKEMNVYMN